MQIMETNIKKEQYDDMMELLKDYLGHDQFTELYFGDKIKEGDVYVYENATVARATDTGSGIYTSHHWPHFRPTSNENNEGRIAPKETTDEK